jgi:TonB family protein
MKSGNFYRTLLALTILTCGGIPARAQTPESPQQKPPMVIRKSTGVLQKSTTRRVEPEYPQEAKAKGIHGIVVVEVKLDQQGNVIATTPVSGQQQLVEAAITALRSWKFPPTQLGGVAVQVIGNVVFDFTADGRVVDGTYRPGDSNAAPDNATINVVGGFAPPVIPDGERKVLLEKLQTAYEIPLRVNNPDGVVLEISKAIVRAVKREEQNYLTHDATTAYVTDYAMQLSLSLHNPTVKKITGVGFKFTNTTARHIFFAYPHIAGVPAQGDSQVTITFMVAAGNPADLLVEVVGVQFADGSKGGAFPEAPRATGSAPMPESETAGEAPPPVKVERRPIPLNRLRPNYPEQARRNKVSGTVRLRLKVGADGSVKRIFVANALPDGLTEEAIRVGKVIQFQPAMADGKPVDFWIAMDVDFNLR